MELSAEVELSSAAVDDREGVGTPLLKTEITAGEARRRRASVRGLP